MNQHNVHLLDLPNEIIFLILKKLTNIDVLYSFLGIKNRRLNIIAQEEIFNNILNFVFTLHSPEQVSSISNSILKRFCVSILPRIHHKVKSLSVESTLMECILGAGQYRYLSTLKIYNFNPTIVSRYFMNDSHLRHIGTQQITDLTLISIENSIEITEGGYTDIDYGTILPFFENLVCLSIVVPSNYNYLLLWSYKLPSKTSFFSTLMKLCISVCNFYVVLALLGGSFKQLTTFIVEVSTIDNNISTHYKMDNLPTLKHFSLISYEETNGYYISVLPLLRRMSNLEELTLYIRITDGPTFISGSDLDNEILSHMPQLHTFTFYFDCETAINKPIIRVSVNDIQRTFTNIKNQQIFCMVDHVGYLYRICRVFTIPLKFDRLEYISNNIPNIVLKPVTHVNLREFDPFKHEFFVQLARTFPFLKYLIIWNYNPPFWGPDGFGFLNKDGDSLIEYPHLISIDTLGAHNYYVEQFLNETKTRLPCLKQLKIKYEHLEKVTQNFTRIQTRRNCAQIKQLIVERPTVYSKDIYDYFPLLSV